MICYLVVFRKIKEFYIVKHRYCKLFWRVSMKNKLLYLCLVIFWIAVIFSLSNETALESSKKSRAITNVIVKGVSVVDGKIFEVVNLEFFGNTNVLHNRIRSLGHVLEYFTLTFFLILLLNKVKFSIIYIYCIAWIISTIISVIDEFNQTFVLGRGGEFRDIVVDNIGIMACIFLYYIYSKILRRVRVKVKS